MENEKHGKKERILVVMDTYYPDSRATTYIMQQILERLSESYEIHVFALDLFHRVADNARVAIHNNIAVEYVRPVPNRYSIVRKIYAKIVSWVYFKKYHVSYRYDRLSVYANQIVKTIKRLGIKKLISVSSPTDIHICCEMAIRRIRGVHWTAVCMDPHANNCAYSLETQQKLRNEELILFQRANKILMLRQAETDYRNSQLADKIIYFELPLPISDNAPKTRAKAEPINIMYTGNFYRKIRNPDSMLETFATLHDVDYRLYIIGSFSGWNDDLESYLDLWKSKFKGKLVIVNRVPRAEMEKLLQNADFLVSLGNTTYNQCASKVLEYIATGKPIIHFQKIENCAAIPYLKKYPNTCIVREENATSVNASAINAFIQESRETIVSADVLKETYKENLYPNIAELFLHTIEDLDVSSVNK